MGAKWIWGNNAPKQDEYFEFFQTFEWKQGEALLRISADSNFATYINGQITAFGQYADYPYDKIYDEIDITPYCREGENSIAIVAWYCGGETTSVYFPGEAGLFFEISGTACQSGQNTLARLSRSYISHLQHSISPQLGWSYRYDSTAEDQWMKGALEGFAPAIEFDRKPPLRSRPCKRLELLPTQIGQECKKIGATDVIYDLGKETVGFLEFEFYSPCVQEVTIAFGEHLIDGCVRRIIGPRDFSISYRAKEGQNCFMGPFRRLGCRYLEFHSEAPLTIQKAGIAPTVYPIQEQARPALNEMQRQIYDLCVETLKLCMHEHYEDCPWREQALYAMDSRNQMLCGYYAFKEYEFPRSNLQLFANDRREDGLLSICAPTRNKLAIPSFSLHYITACLEYLQHSGDTAFLKEIYPKLCSILKVFTDRIKDGLIPPFEGDGYWNFYEWSEGLSGNPRWGKIPEAQRHLFAVPDLPLNALVSIALQKMAMIADLLGYEQNYLATAEEINQKIRSVFWNGAVYTDRPETTQYSQLGNALAILCGAADQTQADALCKKMENDPEMTPVTLSMACFKYDAWLKTDAERYTPIVLKTIEKIYRPMIDFGSTTVWETEGGADDFGNAGSLCHGWSALPIYYYHTLNK